MLTDAFGTEMAQDYESRWHNSIPSAILKAFPGPLGLSHAHTGTLQFCCHSQLPSKQSSSFVENADSYSAFLFLPRTINLFLRVEGRYKHPGLLDSFSRAESWEMT